MLRWEAGDIFHWYEEMEWIHRERYESVPRVPCRGPRIEGMDDDRERRGIHSHPIRTTECIEEQCRAVSLPLFPRIDRELTDEMRGEWDTCR